MKGRVLIVDDDADLRDTVCTALADEGYECVGASSGAEALDRLRSGDLPQIILLDLMMPVMDGWTFLEQQQRDPRLAHIPVLVLSASPRVEDLAPDAARALRKPMDLETLLSAVSETIAAQS
jgi:CheY-like chemotaxis protein